MNPLEHLKASFLYHPDGVHVGDDADPHRNGFILIAYCHMPGDLEDMQGAICLVPETHRAPYRQPHLGSGPTHAGNYLTYQWDGLRFTNVQAHWNIVEAVRRYVDELGGDI